MINDLGNYEKDDNYFQIESLNMENKIKNVFKDFDIKRF